MTSIRTQATGVAGTLRALALATLVAGVAAARAGEPVAAAAPDYTRFWLDELAGMDVDFGIASYDEKTIYTPAAVTVISADEIAAYGWRTLGEVLASVRGFHVSRDRSYDYIGARGFGRPGDYNTRVLLLCDGHPVNDIIYGSAYAGSELYLDLATVKRIRIMHGPSAAVYGDGAFFAVVNLVTKDGEDHDVGSAGVEAGSGGLGRVDAAWGGPSPLGGSLFAGATHIRRDGDDIHWAEFDDPATNDGLFQGGDGERIDRLFAKWSTRGLQATAAWTSRRKGIPTGEWGMVFNDTDAWGQDDRLAVGVSGLRLLSDHTALRARVSYDDFEYTGNYPFDDDAEGPEDPYTWRYVAHGRWLSGELQWCGVLGGRHRVLAGASFRRSVEGLQTGEVVESGEQFLLLDDDLGNAGLYLQDQLVLGPGSSLYLGVRQDSYRSFGPNLSLRAALVARLDRRTHATLAYGGAFRAPNAYELYYDDGDIQKGNPDLQPEIVDTWEAVCERELTRGIRGSLTLFHNHIDRLIEQVADPGDGRLVFVNMGAVKTEGAEFELDGRLLDGINGRLSFCCQRADDAATGELLTNAPARLFKLNLSTSRFDVPLAGAVEVQHISRRRTLGGGWAPAYAVLNLDATWWTPLKGLQLDVAVDNALDQRFGDPGGGHQVQDVLAREGRRYLARLGWHW